MASPRANIAQGRLDIRTDIQVGYGTNFHNQRHKLVQQTHAWTCPTPVNEVFYAAVYRDNTVCVQSTNTLNLLRILSVLQ
jgi:hypothetical protein